MCFVLSFFIFFFYREGGREGKVGGREVCVWGGGGEGDVVVSGRMTQEM